MRFCKLILSTVFLFTCVFVYGAVTTTEETIGTVKQVTFVWTSDASGNAAAGTAETYTGEVLAFVTVPDGTDPPSAAYDVTIKSGTSTATGPDVLAGRGLDRSATVTQTITSATEPLMPVANDTLYISVSNAGNTKSGTAYLYIR